MKVNLGCGQAYMPGWVNVDASPDVKADIYLDAPEFVRQYGEQVDEVYMGHFLEHLLPGDSLSLLAMLCERLPKGAVVSAVTPDMAAIWAAYQSGEVTNDQLNASFIYSYVQPSRHVWCYDEPSLLKLFRRAGFPDPEPIDPHTWPPVYHKEGVESRWQCGVRASALGAPPTNLGSPPDIVRLRWADVFEVDPGEGDDAPHTLEHLLMHRVQTLRESLTLEADKRVEAEERAALYAPPAAPPGRQPERPLHERPQAPPVPTPTPDTPAGEEASPRRRARVREVVKEKLPTGTRRREVAKAALATYRETVNYGVAVRRAWHGPGLLEDKAPKYDEWLRQRQSTAEDLKAQTDFARHLVHPSRIHVAVLPGAGPLSRTLKSLAAQSWPYWTASVCTDERGNAWPDKRISAAPNTGELATDVNQSVVDTECDFVIVLRAGETLAPDCAYQVASAAHQDALVDLVTWDDDMFGVEERRSSPRFRPLTWSPEMLLGANYLDHSFAIRRRRFLATGGIRAEYGDAVFWDLLLRAGLTEERVAHVSRVLSTVVSRPAAVTTKGVQVVQEQLDRLGWEARAESDGSMVRVRWALSEQPHVTVIIPTRHNRKMLSTCLPSLARSDYPSFDVVIVDNGGHNADNEQWYTQNHHGLELDVIWWEKDFNYSEVNNVAAAKARGDVLIFLNDDTEILDPGWMTELVGWSTRPEIGVAGLQLVGPDDRLQHAGVVLGMGGFADHVFAGMRPGEDSLFGSTRWYRNTLAVTGACLGIRRELFESLDGFDERFLLCGSDVVLGLDSVLRRLRNICSPYARVRHLESFTRGSNVPQIDFFSSYWRYNTWLFGGDPYYSPNLSLSSHTPALRSPTEPTVRDRLRVALGRRFETFHQNNDSAEAQMLAAVCRAVPADTTANIALHAQNAAPFQVETVNWFLPDIDSPFYGGINTALRIADTMAREHGVRNRFVVFGEPNEMFIRSALAAAMPALADSEIVFYRLDSPASLEAVPYADVSIATLWVTAYSVAHFPHTKRKFYLIQDYEPGFYPAGTTYALAEESYRLGLYGLCNTDNLRKVYEDEYAGRGMSFTPAVDQNVFHARGRHERSSDSPVTLFVYARPGHTRNCWEMAAPALEELKRRLGDRVRIVAAGAWAVGTGAEMDIKRLGLLDYQATGELYRNCDVGMALTVSRHPSYLPLELMACGVPVVAFDNPWGHWILKDGENSLLAKRTVDGLVDSLERMCVDSELRGRLGRQALTDIADRHADWDSALAGIYPYLCDPEGHNRAGSDR